MDDSVEISYEVGKREDGSLWTVTVTCPAKLSELEFAAAIKSLADDILSGSVSFDGCPDVQVVDHESH